MGNMENIEDAGNEKPQRIRFFSGLGEPNDHPGRYHVWASKDGIPRNPQE
jgi:hypothetical protein